MSDARSAGARTRVVLATRNAGKIADFQHLLDAAQLPIDVVSVGEFAGLADTVETGVTFEENARLKAENAKLLLICEAQKKVSQLLGLTLPTIPDTDEKSEKS